MSPFFILVGTGVLIFLVMAGKRSARHERHREWMKAPFPAAWEEYLQRNLAPYSSLPSHLRSELHGLINIFMHEKNFEGCGGLEITDEIKVTIAAQACLLLLNHETHFYPKLRTVLVYPSAYVAGRKGLFNRDAPKSVRLGEAWLTGSVVLSWDDVLHGGLDFKDGHNVTIHEFAHRLDQEDGASDGAPILSERSAYRAWAKILGREYAVLRKRANKGGKTVMRRYGATNPAEFFAVVTETFFEKPRQLHAKHPDLYEEMKMYYNLHPLEWVNPKGEA